MSMRLRRRRHTCLAMLLMVLALAVPASSQGRIPRPPVRSEPTVAPRVFLLASAQQFAAADTFEAAFGRAVQPFFGGGVQVAWRNGLFVDGTVSYFRKTGQRVFQFEGERFDLGIPLTASVLPLELTGGYRWRRGRRANATMTPYVGGGVGSYGYKEESAFDASGDDVDLRSLGYLAVAGAEFRVSRRVWTAVDVQYTRVPGIFGDAGLSQALGEDDLGGIAVRVRLLVGN